MASSINTTVYQNTGVWSDALECPENFNNSQTQEAAQHVANRFDPGPAGAEIEGNGFL
jgi:hypothetical protein